MRRAVTSEWTNPREGEEIAIIVVERELYTGMKKMKTGRNTILNYKVDVLYQVWAR